jgi:hypothetical protein
VTNDFSRKLVSLINSVKIIGRCWLWMPETMLSNTKSHARL